MLFYLPDSYLIGMAIWLLTGGLALVLSLRLRRRWKATRKQAIAGFALSIWLLLAVLTVAEIGFALFYDTTDAFNLTNVSTRWYRIHCESQQRALSIGRGDHLLYRDSVGFAENPLPDQHHILFIGDSFTFGHGVTDVEARFSNLVRQQLETLSPGKFRVSNISDSGTDLFWVETALSRLVEARFRIDTVVYVMCLNDIETFDSQYQEFYGNLAHRRPEFFLLRDTYLLNFLYFRMIQFRMSEVRDYYALLTDFYEGEPWQRMSQILTQLNEGCAQFGTELRIVVFPFLHNTDGDYDCAAAHEVVVRFCNQSSIPVLDLADDLLPHVDEGLTVNPFDTHPNERAHAIAAKAIVDRLLNDLSP
jgi:lysophospholipase L1-like esterase